MLTTGTKYDSIDWAALEHAYGPADDLPPILMDLMNPEKAEGAIDQLCMGPLHQETLYTSTGPAMAIAALFLAEGKCPFPEELSELLAVFADLVEIYVQDDSELEDDEETIGIIASCQEALADSAEFLLPCAAGDGPIARTAIAFQKYHPHREKVIPVLTQRLLGSNDDNAVLSAWILGCLGGAFPASISAENSLYDLYLLGRAFGGYCPAENTVGLAKNWPNWAPLLEKIAGEDGVGAWLARANPEAATYFLEAAPPCDREVLRGLTHVARTSRRWGPVAARAVVAHVMNPQCCIDPADLILNLRQLAPDESVREALIVAAGRCETEGPWGATRADLRADVVMSLVEAGDPRWEDVLESLIRGTHPHKSYMVSTSETGSMGMSTPFHEANPQPSRRILKAVLKVAKKGNKESSSLLSLISCWPPDFCAEAIPLARQCLPQDPFMMTVLARWEDTKSLPVIKEMLRGTKLSDYQKTVLRVLRGKGDRSELLPPLSRKEHTTDADELHALVFTEKKWADLRSWQLQSVLRSALQLIKVTGQWPGSGQQMTDLIRLGLANRYPLDAIALAEKSLALDPEIQREVAGLLREEIAKDRRLPSIGFAAVDDEIFLSRARVLLAQLENN
ncbi:MAG: hypothetical protein Q4C87_04205 [Actinomycetaceae bacterium]|nr:hypothetical protein [Actinomycetaceae bacterium]